MPRLLTAKKLMAVTAIGTAKDASVNAEGSGADEGLSRPAFGLSCAAGEVQGGVGAGYRDDDRQYDQRDVVSGMHHADQLPVA